MILKFGSASILCVCMVPRSRHNEQNVGRSRLQHDILNCYNLKLHPSPNPNSYLHLNPNPNSSPNPHPNSYLPLNPNPNPNPNSYLNLNPNPKPETRNPKPL